MIQQQNDDIVKKIEQIGADMNSLKIQNTALLKEIQTLTNQRRIEHTEMDKLKVENQKLKMELQELTQ